MWKNPQKPLKPFFLLLLANPLTWMRLAGQFHPFSPGLPAFSGFKAAKTRHLPRHILINSSRLSPGRIIIDFPFLFTGLLTRIELLIHHSVLETSISIPSTLQSISCPCSSYHSVQPTLTALIALTRHTNRVLVHQRAQPSQADPIQCL